MNLSTVLEKSCQSAETQPAESFDKMRAPGIPKKVDSRTIPTRLFLLIRSLGYGGAERQLIELIKGLDKQRFEITIATFYDGGGLWSEMAKIKGINLLSLHKKSRWDLALFLWRLWRAVHDARPEILHGYMSNANELCLLMSKLVGGRVVWGLRMSNRDLSRYDWATAWGFRIDAWFSSFADLVIVNSHAGKRDHASKGYCDKRMLVIHNGIDVDRFVQNSDQREQLRQEWKIRQGEYLIGVVARLDPQKDHATFLRAAAILAWKRPNVRFVCVGDGPEPYRKELQAIALSLGLDGRLKWLPASNNVVATYNALDLFTLPSVCGEGFANVVGEAMACKVPVVVTDAGDSALIVGNRAQVVPVADPESLAAAWTWMMDLTEEQRVAITTAQRARIVSEFSTAQLVTRTVAALENIQ